jgi:hypothetical protein
MVTAAQLKNEIRRREVGGLSCPPFSAPVKAFCRKGKSMAKRVAALAKNLSKMSNKRKSGGRARMSRKSKKAKM